MPQSVVRYQSSASVFRENSLTANCTKKNVFCCREQSLIKDVELNHNGEKILEKLVRRHY